MIIGNIFTSRRSPGFLSNALGLVAKQKEWEKFKNYQFFPFICFTLFPST
jgi:hypothetical protein